MITAYRWAADKKTLNDIVALFITNKDCKTNRRFDTCTITPCKTTVYIN